MVLNRVQRYNKKLVYARKMPIFAKNAEKFVYVKKKQYFCGVICANVRISVLRTRLFKVKC